MYDLCMFNRYLPIVSITQVFKDNWCERRSLLSLLLFLVFDCCLWYFKSDIIDSNLCFISCINILITPFRSNKKKQQENFDCHMSFN
jgi:hypothetical protein